jgi:hypothetical protein
MPNTQALPSGLAAMVLDCACWASPGGMLSGSQRAPVQCHTRMPPPRLLPTAQALVREVATMLVTLTPDGSLSVIRQPGVLAAGTENAVPATATAPAASAAVAMIGSTSRRTVLFSTLCPQIDRSATIDGP